MGSNIIRQSGKLDALLSSQLNSIKAISKGKKMTNNILILVNYMPVMKFMKNYIEIDESIARNLKKMGFEVTYQDRSVPSIKAIPGYAFFLGVIEPVLPKSKDEDTANKKPIGPGKMYVNFKANPNGKDYPPLVKVGNKYYWNPNVILLEDAICNGFNASIVGKYIVKSDNTESRSNPKRLGWNVACNTQEILEFPCFNYVCDNILELQNYYNIINEDARPNIDNDILKYYNTHMFIAHTELGHYYSTFRSKFAYNPPLCFSYSNEFVPIYYNLGVDSPITRIGQSSNGKFYTWADVLVNILQPSEKLLNNYIDIPDICRNIVMNDKCVNHSLRGEIINNPNPNPVYFLSRKDHGILSNLVCSRSSTDYGNTKDTYCYRLTMPYLFNSLFETIKSSETNTEFSIPVYFKPEEWIMRIYSVSGGVNLESDLSDEDVVNPDSMMIGEESNSAKNTTHKENINNYVFFDIKPDSSAGVIDNDYIFYSTFAFNSLNNYLKSDNVDYHILAYTSKSTQNTEYINKMCTTYTEESNNMMLEFYKQYLDTYFVRINNS